MLIRYLKKLSLIIVLLFIFPNLTNAQLFSEKNINIYGWFDLEFEKSNKDDVGKMGTFDQHHLNVISIYKLDNQFRLFTEMEWEHGGTYESGKNGSGKIYLTRAWVEFKHNDAVKIQAGKILVPFGIYGERYDATPAFFSTFLPNSIYGKHENSVGLKDRLYSKWLTGIQILGNAYVADWSIQYYGYFTNGRGPKPDEKDNNANKGIGGRFIITPPSDIFDFGVSYYSDQDGNSYHTEQQAIGLDCALRYSNFFLEAEFIHSSGEKVDTNLTPVGNFQKMTGYYFQGAYKLFDKLTPFARYDFFDPDNSLDKNGEVDITIGINFSFTHRVFLKSEVHFYSYQNTQLKNYEKFVSSVAVAF